MSGLFQSSPPDLAIEIGAEASPRRGPVAWIRRAVLGYVVEPLPPGTVVPSLVSPNIPDVTVVAKVLTQVLSRLGGRSKRAALVVPDTVAKVSLIRFEKVASSQSDLMELVRWQVRKSARSRSNNRCSYLPAHRPKAAMISSRSSTDSSLSTTAWRRRACAPGRDLARHIINSVLAGEGGRGRRLVCWCSQTAMRRSGAAWT